MAAFRSVLVANRGEIAVRVMRTCREMGITTIAVYSDVDRFARHTREADLAVRIGPAPARDSYLNIPAIIAAAKAAGADAIHPGYGFLSENPAFAEACEEAEIVFIGPPPSATHLMGSKTAAKNAVMASDVPVVPGFQEPDATLRQLQRAAEKIGFPVLIKASAGGGGKGMREVRRASEFADALAAAQRESLAAFGDASVFLEKLIEHPRHVEFQIIADRHGNCLYLGERECSIQRRHQKVVEESPSVALDADLRARMGNAAVRAARAAGYVNAGTVEFLLDASGQFYFLEMNTRLQVEHPVTEQVMGCDLVRMQLAVAAGEPLPLRQEQIAPRGHAIEMRVYAEDPVTFLPSTGPVLAWEPPQGPGIRLDAGVAVGDEVTMQYDPMLAKLIVTAEDRPSAVARLAAALDDFAVLGIATNLPLLRRIVADERFAAGQTFTDFLEDPRYAEISADVLAPEQRAILLAAGAICDRESQAAASQARRSPWAAGALRAGRFTERYLLHGEPVAVELRDEPTLPGALWAMVAGQPVALDPAMAADLIHWHRRAGSAEVVLRQGMRQARCWAVKRADGAILVTDSAVTLTLEPPRPLDVDVAARGGASAGGDESLTAPMAGTVVQVRVAEGDVVSPRQTLIILSAMKMEHAIVAPVAARVHRLHCQAGDVVAGGTVLVELTPIADEETA
jgi:3-methylcrotonyl-CoA carboxylase alpha subunit